MLVQCIVSQPVEEDKAADLKPAESGAIIIGGFSSGQHGHGGHHGGYGHHGHHGHHGYSGHGGHHGGSRGGFAIIGSSNRG